MRLLIAITFIGADTSGKIASVGIIIKVFLTRQWPELYAGSGVPLCLMSSDQGPRCWRSLYNCFTVAAELDISWLFVTGLVRRISAEMNARQSEGGKRQNAVMSGPFCLL